MDKYNLELCLIAGLIKNNELLVQFHCLFIGRYDLRVFLSCILTCFFCCSLNHNITHSVSRSLILTLLYHVL